MICSPVLYSPPLTHLDLQPTGHLTLYCLSLRPSSKYHLLSCPSSTEKDTGRRSETMSGSAATGSPTFRSSSSQAPSQENISPLSDYKTVAKDVGPPIQYSIYCSITTRVTRLSILSSAAPSRLSFWYHCTSPPFRLHCTFYLNSP